jgi:nifR3 family TIM-barrel protein
MNETPTHPLTPVRLGSIAIDPPLILAPMSGYTSYAFRSLCREVGDCGLVYTGLLNANGIVYQSYRTRKMLDWRPDEAPIAVQVYGHEPAKVAEAARRVVALGADIVDINMGCAVYKITRRGAGAALMKDAGAAARMVEAVTGAVGDRTPVTVKLRSGWDADHVNALAVARAVEAAGAAALAVHPRTAKQQYTGRADWPVIAAVKAAVRVPVFGSGDVRTPGDAARILQQTGCDGVMVGRAALGDPWIFRRIAHGLRTGEALPLPNARAKAKMALRHARRAVATSTLEEWQVIHELRGQLVKYHLGVPGAAEVRARLVRIGSLDDVETILSPLL